MSEFLFIFKTTPLYFEYRYIRSVVPTLLHHAGRSGPSHVSGPGNMKHDDWLGKADPVGE
jgi:hypothetical protein